VYKELLPERANVNFPIHKEEKITTLDKPVIIESAYPGWLKGGKRFPAVPRTIAEQVNEMVDSIKAGDTAPQSIVGVYPGGRNRLPILTLGLLLGSQLVRVGIEDTYWVYPHKDEIIEKNSDMVKLAVDLARCLGRRVVTDADEARKILGMKLTSKF